MNSIPHPHSAPTRLWRALLACLSLDKLSYLFDVVHIAQHWWQRSGQQGMYEILEYDLSLELRDTKGKTAHFKKRQRVKFSQDQIITFQDYAWGDGDIFHRYDCSPGLLVDRYQDGDRWNILISLRSTKNRGDVEDFRIERIAKDGFTQAEESLQTEIRHPTRHLRVTIIFPKGRPCRWAVLNERSRHRMITLGPKQMANLPDGRQMLIWETRKIREFEIYTIRWRW